MIPEPLPLPDLEDAPDVEPDAEPDSHDDADQPHGEDGDDD